MTYLKELISIPERVHKGDFVLKLTEGVTDPAETLRQYVVTPALVDNFDHSLDLVRGAVDSGKSRAAYLHGSFGSGKSHFMAVLYLLLRGEAAARGIRELAPVVDKHIDWLEGRRFLMVPYHLIGARNLESAILGGYAKHVREAHPDQPQPAVYLAEGVLDDARGLREKMRDSAFFDGLRTVEDDEGGGWGDLGSGWDAETFDGAAAAPPGDPDRQRLIGDLLESYFPSQPKIARETGEGFVGLDTGLAEISRHAESLGYDALILFLDELILWLASHAGDLEFLNREGQKLAKLVESTEAHRPVPIVSFIARQRDLRELIGEHVPGAEKLGFSDVLRWWEGRFDTIPLENRNLPTIVEKRLLAPKNEEARRQVDKAFSETVQARDEILQVLQGAEADRETFRRVYPFSPALVETLVAVSSLLQRERTALKLLLQLLVDQRDKLQVGDLVPVGDLFDVLESGDEPFTEEMRRHFDAARRLYRTKLRPLLEATHDLAGGAEPPTGPEGAAFRADDRLVKTLLLAALAPEAEPLKALTPLRLSALNHGSIRTPLPGREAQTVLQKCRTWAQAVGEVRIGEGSDPTITLQLSGVDTQSILDKARSEDNIGNRRRKLRELLFEALGLSMTDELFTEYELLWRGTNRRIDIVFGNVRDRSELPDESLRARGSRWKLVLDFPFDPDNRSPRDDLARLQAYSNSTQTVCWLPSFFSHETLEKLGRLVILDHVLAGERFRDYSSHLSAVDQQSARALLENQQAQLHQGLRQALEVAYGVADSPRSAVDDAYGLDEHLHSLYEGFHPRPPVSAHLTGALERLAEQMLACQFPAHPKILLDREVKPRDLEKIFTQVERAAEDPDGRVRVDDRGDRGLLQAIAAPLQLGEAHEAHFLLRDHWVGHLRQELGGEPGEVTVKQAREILDRPDAMGLRVDLADLIVRVWALQTNRGFFLHGAAVDGSATGSLPDDLVLRKEPLPPTEVWEGALDRAHRMFGLAPHSTVRTAGNVGALAAELKTAAVGLRQPAEELQLELETARERLGLSEETPRLRHAKAALRVLSAIGSSEKPAEAVQLFAEVELGAEPKEIARSLKSAESVTRALLGADWQILEAAWKLKDGREQGAEANRNRVLETVSEGQLAIGLEAEMKRLRDDAARLLADVPGPVDESTEIVARGRQESVEPKEASRILREIEEGLEGHPERRLRIDWTITGPKKS